MIKRVPNPDAYPRLRLRLEPWWQRRSFLRQPIRWRWLLGGLLIVLAVIIVAVPFALPLGSPAPVAPASLADPNGAFVQIDGEMLYYVHEPGTGQAVALIHGFGGSTVTWQETIPALADAGYDVYALDLLGFGLSDKGWTGDYSHAAQAQRVVQWMDATGIDRAVIVGHSMGGNVAVHIAAAYPDRVDALVLVDAAILTNSEFNVPEFLLDLPFVRRWAQIGLRRVVMPEFENLLADAAYNDGAITPELTEAYKRVLYTPDWDLGLMGIIRDSDHNRLPVPVSTIRVPTLILWGEQDTWVDPADGERLDEQIPNSERVVFAGAGHLPMHEVPDEFNAAVITFLDRQAQK